MKSNKLYIVLVKENKEYNIIETSFYDHIHNSHFQAFTTIQNFDGIVKQVWLNGDYIYEIEKVNKPIELFGNQYQVLQMKQCGYYYTLEKSQNNQKFEFLFQSISFTSYEKAYEAMRKEAMNFVKYYVDLNNDLKQGNKIYNFKIRFEKNEICVINEVNEETLLYTLKK